MLEKRHCTIAHILGYSVLDDRAALVHKTFTTLIVLLQAY